MNCSLYYTYNVSLFLVAIRAPIRYGLVFVQWAPELSHHDAENDNSNNPKLKRPRENA
jgi:hypothetical protein